MENHSVEEVNQHFLWPSSLKHKFLIILGGYTYTLHLCRVPSCSPNFSGIVGIVQSPMAGDWYVQLPHVASLVLENGPFVHEVPMKHQCFL